MAESKIMEQNEIDAKQYEQRIHELRQKFGLPTDSGSMYTRFRTRGYSDLAAAFIVFRGEGLLDPEPTEYPAWYKKVTGEPDN